MICADYTCNWFGNSSIILYATTNFMVGSTKIITDGFNDFKNRTRIYNLNILFNLIQIIANLVNVISNGF